MVRGPTKDKVLRRDALPVPENLPTKTRCIQVTIPDDIEYLMQFNAVVYLLCKWNSYQQDGGHKAADVAQLWRDVLAENPIITCEVPAGNGGIDEGNDLMIRQNPDNPCILESSIDGITWCQWADLSLCLTANPAQPTGGGQPGAGSETCNHVVLPANGTWLLPFQVNAGDVVTLSNLSGGWTDGTIDWFCPDGNGYSLGLCGGGFVTDGGDPLPTNHHMQIIALVDGVYYPLTEVPLTIPAGVTNENLVLQANDGSLSDNSGTVQATICVSRPQETFALTYDVGSGPAIAVDGQLITITGAAYAQPPSDAAYNLTVHVSPCANFEIVASSGWTDNNGAGGAPSWNRFDCASTQHPANPPQSIATFGVQETTILGLNSVTPFTITVRVTHI